MAPAQAWRETRPDKGTQCMALESWTITRDGWLLLLLVWLVWMVRVMTVTKKENGKGEAECSPKVFGCECQKARSCLSLSFDLRLEGLQAPVTRFSNRSVVETLWANYKCDM